MSEQTRRPTMAELRAKYGPNWGLSSGTMRDEVEAVAQRRREEMQRANDRIRAREWGGVDRKISRGLAERLEAMTQEAAE